MLTRASIGRDESLVWCHLLEDIYHKAALLRDVFTGAAEMYCWN